MRIVILLPVFLMASQSMASSSGDSIIPPVIVRSKNSYYSLTHAPKSVITQQDLTDIGATSLTQALQELGGVQLQDTSGNGSQVLLSMRGFGDNASSNTLLLINGIPLTNPDLAPPDLNAIPLQEIESIEIIAGSESVLYGDQAVGGIINIVTHAPSKRKLELTCAGGSYNQRNCYGTWQDHYKQFNYGIAVLNNHTDNYRDHNDYGQSLLSGNLNYLYQTGSLAFNYQVANERMQYPGALTAAQVAQNRRQANNDTNFFRDWTGFYTLKQKQQLNTNWNLETDVARREMHGDGVLTSSFSQSRTTHFLKPQLKGTWGKCLLVTGLDFEDDHYHIRSLYGPTDDAQQKYGLFGVINYPINPLWSLSLGARGAQQNNLLQSSQITHSVNRAFASTLGASYLINPQTKIYLRRAESFRFPKADEDAFTPIGVNGLRPQRGVSYEAGTEWRYRELLSKLSIYQLNLRDEIMFDPFQTPQQPFGANTNLAPTVRRGFSLVEKYPFTRQLTLDGQYNYINARFQSGSNAGNRIPLVSENILHAGANCHITECWNLYAEAIYTGSQYAANDNQNIAGTIGGYTIYNLNLRYDYQRLSISFRANNIFNKYYYYYTVYQPSAQQEFFYPAAGVNFLLTAKYALI